jgi:[glutamine synthetase] adenylyltransferase / [glutamine synthetase]-adenylyl-L-tyrosine phosphorylase
LYIKKFTAELNKIKKDFFSKDFTGFLVECVGGFISPGELEIFLDKLQTELSKFNYSKSSEANLIRLLSSLFDKTAFINSAVKLPHHLEIISAIVSCSNFLTDIVVQNPGFLYQVLDDKYLQQPVTKEMLDDEIRNNISRYKSHISKLNYLKQVKKRCILKIGLADILGFAGLTETTSRLSTLAVSLLSELFNICRHEVETKYNVQIPEGSYCLTSLGKLGGGELNYSSDVDLMLFYEQDYVPPGNSNKEYFELLNETALLFIKSSSQITEKGYLYRIDFRLRPDGKNSPLCRPITDYMRYYEARGENWERQMLIKMRFLTGNSGLFYSFYYYLQGFIFPASPVNSIKEEISKIKKNIERKIEGADNIKLFPGGIRDIEFSVQALQLLNGGRIRELRNGNTLESIELLLKNNLLTRQERDILTEAYIFYRKTEHFLQLMNDRQTHLIPDDKEIRGKLAQYIVHGNAKDFEETLLAHREKTRKIFTHIIKPDSALIAALFSKINFSDMNRSGKNFKFLQSGAGILSDKGFETKTIENFRLIENDIIKYLIKSPAPDRTIENFAKVIKASNFPNLWYAQLQNKFFLKSFLTICEFSQKSIDIIASNRQAEDRFISGNCFFIPDSSAIGEMDFNEFLLTLSVLYTIKGIREKEFSAFLSEYIDARVKAISKGFLFTYFIASLGSYGAKEMNFASDIDFLIVIDNEDNISAAEKEYEELIKKLRKEIGSFEIDLRLRPEGKSSQLVRTLKSYEIYLAGRARVWELQSLSKLRFVCGSGKLFCRFKNLVFNKIKTLDSSFIKKEIVEMHRSFTKQNGNSTDLKKSNGGFITIEFVLHSLLLSDINLYKRCIGKPVSAVIKYLSMHSVYKKEMDAFIGNYSRLKKLLLFNQNYYNNKSYKFAESDKQNTIKKIMEENTGVFNKILGN